LTEQFPDRDAADRLLYGKKLEKSDVNILYKPSIISLASCDF